MMSEFSTITRINKGNAVERPSKEAGWKRVKNCVAGIADGLKKVCCLRSKTIPVSEPIEAHISSMSELDEVVTNVIAHTTIAETTIEGLERALTRALAGGLTASEIMAYFNRRTSNDILLNEVLLYHTVTDCVRFIRKNCHSASLSMDINHLFNTYPPETVARAIIRLRSEGDERFANEIADEIAEKDMFNALLATDTQELQHTHRE
jgi:hypothetical protein